MKTELDKVMLLICLALTSRVSEGTHTYARVPAKGEKQWPFNQPFYFILSMQIGGNWVNGSGPTNPAHYPAGMEIDWVRVYSRKRPSN